MVIVSISCLSILMQTFRSFIDIYINDWPKCSRCIIIKMNKHDGDKASCTDTKLELLPSWRVGLFRVPISSCPHLPIEGKINSLCHRTKLRTGLHSSFMSIGAKFLREPLISLNNSLSVNCKHASFQLFLIFNLLPLFLFNEILLKNIISICGLTFISE